MKLKKEVSGIVKRHPDGFGFLIPDDPQTPDVYIPHNAMKGIMSNDRVVAQVFPEKGGQRFWGEITQVLSRAQKKVVGKLHKAAGLGGILFDEGHGWGCSIEIAMGETLNAQEGDLVAVQIVSYGSMSGNMIGKVVQVIGDAEDPLNDIKRVIHAQNLPNEFSQKTLQEASRLGTEVKLEEVQSRKDLRQLNFVTIDGVTAKDFDDAILVKNNNQGFLLWVAIADVSHYVKPGTAIDEDAYERGTSTYFPNFVIPMLPEALSNELCSLKPKVPRLAMVAEMQLNFNGEFVKTDFYEAVIESKARVTYGEAQEIIEGEVPQKLEHVAKDILIAADLAKILMGKRLREGSLDLEIPETEVVVDESGQAIDIIRSERVFAHKLIEELMLIANVAVAEFFTKKQVAAIYRIHEPPKSDSIYVLEKFLKNFGSKMNVRGGGLQKKISKALEEFEGRPEAQILNMLTLRSMNQAKYSHENVGHFGLGFANYTHFTSPIRRYPDLIVHRILKALVVKSEKYSTIGEDELATSGTMLSACEQRSVKAERLYNSIKRARFMAGHVGEEFDGLISSVAKFGIFVSLRAIDVDGLVKIEGLGNERFEFDEDNLRLIGTRTKRQYQIGDLVKITVVSVNVELGQIDFELAGGEAADEPRRSQGAKVAKAKAENQGNGRQAQLKKGSKKQRESTKSRTTNRSDVKKRGETQDDSRGVRTSRVSQRGRKNKAR